MPLDIFVPFWGDPALLYETVASVRSQTSDDWLLTVVDDAYPGDAVAGYFDAIDDKRITYVRLDKNVGITQNYRECIARSTEKMLVLLGCDDVLLPNYVEVVLAAHEAEPTAAIIQPGVQVIDETGAVISTLVDTVKQRLVMPKGSERRLLSGEALASNLLRGNWLYWPSLAFRREVLADFDFRDGFPIIQDLGLVLDMVYAGHSLLHDPTLCFSYRRHTASASSASMYDGSRFAGDRAYFAIAADQARKHGWKRAERAARLRLTTRAHALSLVPGALIRGKASAVPSLFAHAFHR